MTMTVHELKTMPEYFAAVLDGRKTFELRKDDRGFKVGDELVLREWTLGSGYTGNSTRCRVTYIAKDVPTFGLTPGYAILGIEPLRIQA